MITGLFISIRVNSSMVFFRELMTQKMLFIGGVNTRLVLSWSFFSKLSLKSEFNKNLGNQFFY